MVTKSVARFPGFTGAVKRLVDQHRRLKDEPLLLAIDYHPTRRPKDVFLFEVIENFGDGAIDPDRELFEVTYKSSNGFPLEPGQQLHLVLTNPQEFERAVGENWKLLGELRRAIRAGRSRVVYLHPGHEHLVEMLDA